MPFYVRPGVFAREIDLSQVVQGVSSSSGAVVGASDRGAVKSRVRVTTSTKAFIDIFGANLILKRLRQDWIEHYGHPSPLGGDLYVS